MSESEYISCKRSSDSCTPKPGDIETVKQLVEKLTEILTPSSVIVCVGNTLRGDDGAGMAVGLRIRDIVPWKVYRTQTVPENFLMKIVDSAPESVVLIDAFDFGAAAGAMRLFENHDIAGQGPSTHGPAPLAFLDVLKQMHPCRCVVLGIQPEQTGFHQKLSDPVSEGVDQAVRVFEHLAKGNEPS